ncbi:hypothetical protein ACSYAD_32215 [Acaryochloris marina NIES-2412]|uniref:hypothetical protein n=1 Tax=Acaryochloris marina TaxID=155978 RepID=UPI0040595454
MSVSQISQALQKEYESTCDLSVEAVELLLLFINHKDKVDFEFIWQKRNRRNPTELAATLDELISAGLVQEVPDATASDHPSASTEITEGLSRAEFLQQPTGLNDNFGTSC